MSHDHDDGATGMFTADYWDERYRSSEGVWSGKPNAQVVERLAELPPGTALDVGSGEGADAIWLASRGWEVTGVDMSTVGLQRAATRAAAAGDRIAARITWQQADVLNWEPGALRFDLVSAQFMHLPQPGLASLHRRLASAVRPGGTLLIVGHHPSDLHTSAGRGRMGDILFTAEEIAGGLDPAQWQIIAAAAPERQALDPDRQPVTIRDAVLHAVRRP